MRNLLLRPIFLAVLPNIFGNFLEMTFATEWKSITSSFQKRCLRQGGIEKGSQKHRTYFLLEQKLIIVGSDVCDLFDGRNPPLEKLEGVHSQSAHSVFQRSLPNRLFVNGCAGVKNQLANFFREVQRLVDCRYVPCSL